MNRGLFEPLVMYFSLMNSPATFQTMMDEIFEDLISEGVVVVYLDDILIFTEMLDEHRRITCRVLELLEKHKLYLRADKCEFEKTMVEYLGVIISHNSIAMDPVKIAGVAEWPTLTNKKEVQSFLGFTNFYWCFIKDFSEHACPLFDLTVNDCAWRWKASEQSAFNKLKGSVTSSSLLTRQSPSALKLTALTSLLVLSSSRYPQKMRSGTQLRSSPSRCLWLNATTRYTTRRCLRSSGHCRSGGTLSKAPNTHVRY